MSWQLPWSRSSGARMGVAIAPFPPARSHGNGRRDARKSNTGMPPADAPARGFDFDLSSLLGSGLADVASSNGNGNGQVAPAAEIRRAPLADNTGRTPDRDLPSGNNTVAVDEGDHHIVDEELASTPVTITQAAEPPSHADGIHALMKSLDVWFDIEVAMIEKEARRDAEYLAERSLPRLDIQAVGPHEMEHTIAARCTQVFREWLERSRNKLQDAIEASTRAIGRRVAELEAHYGHWHQLRSEQVLLTEQADAARDARAKRDTTFGYPSFLGKAIYVPLLFLLVMIDFVANVPVFSDLLPPDASAAEALKMLGARSETMGLAGGVYRVLARTVMYPDASLLALGVIMFLVFLGHVAGDATRTLASLRESETPDARLGVRRHRRQFWIPAVVSGVGIVFVLFVLFQARTRILSVAETHYAADSSQVVQAQARLDTANAELHAGNDMARLSEVDKRNTELGEQQNLLKDQAAHRDYARAIHGMNWPILFLNMTLLIVAALAAYLHKGETRNGGTNLDSTEADLRARAERARQEAAAIRLRLGLVGADIEAEFGRVRQLLAAHPFQEAAGKQERLSRAIPMFRAENARFRGLDPQNVPAFRFPRTLDFPDVDTAEAAREPRDLPLHEHRYVKLRALLDAALFGSTDVVCRPAGIAA